jgi:hypothetical protein
MLPEDKAAAADALRRNIDWDRLQSLANYHGLIPLLYRHIVAGSVKADAIPETTLTDLKNKAEAAARRNLTLSADLIRLLRSLEEAGIRAVPLKGPVLANLVYGSISLRKILDIDLLVDEGNFRRSIELLETLGYRHMYTAPRFPEVNDLLLRTTHDLALVSPSGRRSVEIHHQFLPASGFARQGLKSIWARLQPSSFMGVPIQVLSTEDLLVYLCEHGAHHTWSRLEWLCGIAEILRQGLVKDWDKVLQCAIEFRSLRRTIAGLQLASELLGAPLPADIVVDSWVQEANMPVLNRIREDPGREPTMFEDLVYQLRTDCDYAARLRRCLLMLFVPQRTDIEAVSLPRPLWPAYYAVRPIRQLLHPFRGLSARKAGRH